MDVPLNILASIALFTTISEKQDLEYEEALKRLKEIDPYNPLVNEDIFYKDSRP
jgi:hypothetical protein